MAPMINKGELILYQTDDGQTDIKLRAIDGTVWLSQLEIAQLFATSKQNVSLHIGNIFKEAELQQTSVVKEYLTTASDGKQYQIKLYNLEMILAIGFRVRTPRGSQFRRWANTSLQEYLVKGFVMDDKRLKGIEQWDYFDEWLARIQDIRASEKRFYQKIRDLYTTSVDYDKNAEQTQLFFKKVQNKMLWAVTGHTAAELISQRSDANKPNMGLTSFAGSIVRKIDVSTAKNYLQQEEIEQLNRIVTMYLDYAEDQAKKRKPINMATWVEKLDAFLQFNERDILTHAGSIQISVAKKLAETRFEEFDAKRKQTQAEIENAQDLENLELFQREFL